MPKARSAQNARRHGLSRLEIPVSDIDALTRNILAEVPSALDHLAAADLASAARDLAEAELRLGRIARYMTALETRALADLLAGDLDAGLARLAVRRRLLRYRNAARRAQMKALQEWATMRHACTNPSLAPGVLGERHG